MRRYGVTVARPLLGLDKPAILAAAARLKVPYLRSRRRRRRRRREA